MGLRPDRDTGWELLNQYNQNQALIRHALAVEAVMARYARIYGEDEEKWGVIGLLHDLDYEMYPQEHCHKSAAILREKGVDEEYIHAVMSHGYGICCDIEPVHVMEKVLYATDELTGLINAAAIMRPSKSVMDLELKSLKKKYKTPNFAAGVNRSVIEKGADMLGVSVDSLMEQCILAMRDVAGEIGLLGNA